MKIQSLIVYKWKEDNSIELLSCFERSRQKGSVKEQLRSNSRLAVTRSGVGRRQSATLEQSFGICNSWVHPQGLGVAVIVDDEYPKQVAFKLLLEVGRIFLEQMKGQWEDASTDLALVCRDIESIFQKFQDPASVDNLVKVQNDVDQLRGVVDTAIVNLLNRGEALDRLVAGSSDLQSNAVQFERNTRRVRCKYCIRACSIL
eukprot:gnl/TRDRNA2_/TRDRNA2_83290_c0_seq1.p1 gnl/TRDRNA2_/TRDRNA2_83290_c0~~gnl/TRDRNA2_/TRDRNA2_83290_c0_seq1.p1  ORF type:complete len:202 (-),score=29.15 gnl/TRDRNA2_/TRDRNA2_83290_c0_seq1:10-615(-)